MPRANIYHDGTATHGKESDRLPASKLHMKKGDGEGAHRFEREAGGLGGAG